MPSPVESTFQRPPPLTVSQLSWPYIGSHNPRSYPDSIEKKLEAVHAAGSSRIAIFPVSMGPEESTTSNAL